MTNTLKITITNGDIFEYSACWDSQSKIEDGFQEEYNVPVDEAVDAALELLSIIYGHDEVADAIKETDYHNIYGSHPDEEDTDVDGEVEAEADES